MERHDLRDRVLEAEPMLGIAGSSGYSGSIDSTSSAPSDCSTFELALMPSLIAASLGLFFTMNSRTTPMRTPASGLRRCAVAERGDVRRLGSDHRGSAV